MTQLSVCLTGDQDFTALIHSRFGNIRTKRLIMKYFLWPFSSFDWSKKGSRQFLVKECAQILVKCKRTKPS